MIIPSAVCTAIYSKLETTFTLRRGFVTFRIDHKNLKGDDSRRLYATLYCFI